MENKLHDFIKQNEFDVHEPHSGHLERFERKLNATKPQKKFSWKWMSVAAAVILSIGFGLGSINQQNQYDLANVSPKMAEAQDFFIIAIHTEMISLEKNRNLETEDIVEDALDQIEDLEDSYTSFVKELKKTGEQRKVINAMISNYQQRLEILKRALQQIETIKNSENLDDEIYI